MTHSILSGPIAKLYFAADTELEPLGLGAHAKMTFQPQPQPREVSHKTKEEPAAPPKEEPLVPAPKAKEEPPKAKEEPARKETPASEDDAVFKTPAKKEQAKPNKPDAPNDEALDAQLKEETKGMTPKAEEKWIKLRKSEAAASKRVTEAEEKIAALQAELKTAAETWQETKGEDQTPKVESLTKEVETLKAQLEEAEKTLAVTQVERSKRYRQSVTEPMGDLTKQVEDMAARYDVSSKDILKALDEDPKERAKVLSDLAADFQEADRTELYGIARDMDRLRRVGEKLRAQAKDDLSAIEEEERTAEERTTKEVATARATSAGRAWDEAASAFDFLNANPDAPEWTAALATARQQSEHWVPGQDAASDGRIRAQAAQHPFLVKAIQHKDKAIVALTEERDRLLKRIEDDNAADPDLGGHGDDAGDHGDDGEGEEMTIGQRAKAAAASGKFGR